MNISIPIHTMTNTRLCRIPVKQKGVVLVVALIMLLVMTSIGVTIMSGSTLQERMASNNRQLSIARMNAESALRQAEETIIGFGITDDNAHTVIANQFSASASDASARYVDLISNVVGLDHDPVSSSLDLTNPTNWVDGNSTAAQALGTSAEAPRFVIEYIGEMPLDGSGGTSINISVETKERVNTIPHVFRITAIGYGQDENITAILQSTYATADN